MSTAERWSTGVSLGGLLIGLLMLLVNVCRPRPGNSSGSPSQTDRAIGELATQFGALTKVLGDITNLLKRGYTETAAVQKVVQDLPPGDHPEASLVTHGEVTEEGETPKPAEEEEPRKTSKTARILVRIIPSMTMVDAKRLLNAAETGGPVREGVEYARELEVLVDRGTDAKKGRWGLYDIKEFIIPMVEITHGGRRHTIQGAPS